MRNRRQTRAFTLIELMVVIGIIGLLVAMVLPSINAARTSARVAATKQMMAVIESGVTQFQADAVVGGELPPSKWTSVLSPHTKRSNDWISVDGASFLAWALVGADLLGTPGFHNLNGNQVWNDDTLELYAIDTNNNTPVRPRSGPFVDISKMTFPTAVQVGQYRTESMGSNSPQTLTSICFLDSFDQPILYYRANTQAEYMVCSDESVIPGIYNADDNMHITGGFASGQGIALDFGAGTGHFANGLGPTDVRPDPTTDRNTFAYTVWNPNVTALVKPHRPDSFILLSAGPDGLYGTADDIANFETNK